MHGPYNIKFFTDNLMWISNIANLFLTLTSWNVYWSHTSNIQLFSWAISYRFTEINLRLTLPYSVRPLCSAGTPESIASAGEASPLKHHSNANMDYYYFLSLSLSGSAAQRGLWPPRSRGLVITHNDAPQSVGLLWTSDQFVAETSTWQHTTHATDKHPCPGGIRTHDRSRRASVDLPLDRAVTGTCMQIWIQTNFFHFIITTIFSQGATASSGPRPPHYRGFTITLRYSTLGITPLDEWSARQRDFYLTTHSNHKRRTSLPPTGFDLQSQQTNGRRPTS
jgi:hypothetical protein